MEYFIVLPAWFWLSLSAIFYASGEFLSEKFVLGPSWHGVLFLVVMDCLSILSWLPALYQKNNLAVTGTLWLMFALVATVLLGLIFFQEAITFRYGIGIVLAGVVVYLLSA